MREVMKRTLQNKLVRILAVVLVAGLAGTWAVGAVRDKHEVAKMTEKMKTMCVGRFLIDMPGEARIALGKINIDGFDINSYGESETEFRARVASREAELRAKPDRLGGKNNLESVRQVNTDNGLVGKIFVHSRTVTEGDAYKGAGEEHYRYEGVAVEALVHAQGVSIDLSTDDYDVDRIENLPRLVAKLVPNPGNQIPTEPGFCIDHAYVRDPLTAEQREEIVMHADLPSHLDIQFQLMSSAGVKPEQGLLERNAEVNAKASFAEKMRVSTLRAAPRTIGTLTGDELVERVAEENHTTVHSFWWEVSGTKDNVLVPDFSFEMVTGQGNRRPVQSSLSDGAALALWDKIVSSVRIRPTQAPKVGSAEPPAPQLGAFASAGDTCPADGWWECRADRDGVTVRGGQRRFIRQGECMPQALLLPPQSLWEKLRGLQPSYEDTDRTPWKLVDRRSRRRVVPDVPLARVTAAAPTAASATERASVGAYAATGKACPASGWWRCEESHALDGTRWIAQGSLLPAATFAVPSRAFGKSGGAPKAIQRRATWKLVKLAQAPGAPEASSGQRVGDAPGQDAADPGSPPAGSAA